MAEELLEALIDFRKEEVIETVKSRAKKGEDLLQILDECRQGMTIVGERYQKGDYFLAELMLSAEIFKGVVAILEPYLSKIHTPQPLGNVILATLQGDIHDLGKNIFATMLKSQGFIIHDLGVDVSPNTVIDKVKETTPDFVGFSALITTAFDGMQKTAIMLKEAGLRERLKLMIGGGVTTSAVKDYVGADFQTTDATEGVAYCIRVMKGNQR